MPVLVENKHGHGAIRLSSLHRKVRRFLHKNIATAGEPFDWLKGYDVESVVGKIQIKDQGTSNSCGGQAMSYFLEVSRKLQGKNEVISAKSMYAPLHYKYGGGMTITNVETQFGAKGGALETEVPSYKSGIPLEEPEFEETSWLTSPTQNEMTLRSGYTPYNIEIDIESMAQAIEQNGGIIIEITGQNNGTWDSAYPQPPSTSNTNSLWHHYMYGKSAVTINGKKYIGFLQSWGTDVGYSGIQYLGENYLNSNLISECISFIRDAEIAPIQNNVTIWASLAIWFNNLFPGVKITA